MPRVHLWLWGHPGSWTQRGAARSVPMATQSTQELKNSIQTKLESTGEYDRCGRRGL